MQYSALAVWEGSALWRGIDVLARIALVTSAMVTVATVFNLVRAALDIPAAGEGSDRVPGRNIDMLVAQASLFTAMKTKIQPGRKTVNLPVRGYISNDGNGRQSVNLVRTEGLHYRIAGLNLLTAVIIYWNTVHLGHAVAERRTKGWMFP